MEKIIVGWTLISLPLIMWRSMVGYALCDSEHIEEVGLGTLTWFVGLIIFLGMNLYAGESSGSSGHISPLYAMSIISFIFLFIRTVVGLINDIRRWKSELIYGFFLTYMGFVLITLIACAMTE